MKLTGKEAAWVCGISDKTLYKYIRLGLIAAREKLSVRKAIAGKVGPVSYEVDLEDLRACPYVTVIEERVPFTGNHRKPPVPTAPQRNPPVISRPLPQRQWGGMVHHDLDRVEDDVMASHNLLPFGSMRFMEFVRMHKVNEWTARDELNAHLIAVTLIDTGRKDGQREKWVTPVQQARMLLVWERLSTPGFEPCRACPHAQDASEAQ